MGLLCVLCDVSACACWAGARGGGAQLLQRGGGRGAGGAGGGPPGVHAALGRAQRQAGRPGCHGHLPQAGWLPSNLCFKNPPLKGSHGRGAFAAEIPLSHVRCRLSGAQPHASAAGGRRGAQECRALPQGRGGCGSRHCTSRFEGIPEVVVGSLRRRRRCGACCGSAAWAACAWAPWTTTRARRSASSSSPP